MKTNEITRENLYNFLKKIVIDNEDHFGLGGEWAFRNEETGEFRCCFDEHREAPLKNIGSAREIRDRIEAVVMRELETILSEAE